MKNFTIKNIVKKFDLKVLYQNEKVPLDKRLITTSGINRGGLQLSGFKSKRVALSKRVVLLSSTESEYIDTLNPDDYQNHFVNILHDHIPAVFVTANFKHSEALIEIAKRLDSSVPIIYFNADSSEFDNTVTWYIAERLAPTMRVHGTLVNIYGYGVLITGPSGIGKSETTLDLIRNGHLFVADDSIDVLKINNKIIGKSNEMLKNLIEIRGIGILDITKMYGYHLLLAETRINLVIKLITANSSSWAKIDRLGTELKYQEYFNVKIPTINIPVTSGRNVADLIASAVISLKLKAAGQDNAIQFQENIIKNLKSDE